jgi:hypothetical protein
MHAFHRDFSSVTPLETDQQNVNLAETCGCRPPPRLPGMPLLAPPPPPLPAHGGTRRLAVIGLAVALALAAVAAWSAVHPDGFGQSRAGCVTVTIPSSTGGALLHACGARARAMCRGATSRQDRLSLLITPRCKAAGLP